MDVGTIAVLIVRLQADHVVMRAICYELPFLFTMPDGG